MLCPTDNQQITILNRLQCLVNSMNPQLVINVLFREEVIVNQLKVARLKLKKVMYRASLSVV